MTRLFHTRTTTKSHRPKNTEAKDTTFRLAIPFKESLAVTLRVLATGDSYASLMYTFKISKQRISTTVTEVCRALTEGLKETILFLFINYFN